MVLDLWLAGGEYGPQAACDIAGRLLLHEPADEYAFDLVDYVVFRERERAAAGVRRAFAADPSLAYEDVRARVLRCMGLAETDDAACDEALPPRDAW
ncbi:hypothetical protein [Nannocystis pusilla]|uniref:Uncharacterized protein n=1 Tax=Nannocystis pusilla TaxID=889268 RepID=A0ABS7TVN4_9BACT|nr:hypothetical protein [Nannocystis pusilla]MBZ5712096.1 hypothetical protein [Nannocystis pusilla]